ncbi:unnamed protein product [Dicrocoelium dendriticum]|nr:unnamed protein product [Dicrocoelium dendriticum]
MSHAPPNLYGNMTNAADTYYGALFSHLSYGMGENGASTATINPDSTAVAAAMAAVSGINTDWASMSPTGYPQNSGPLLGPPHQAGTLHEFPTPCTPDASSTSSPYAATLLAAVAAAAAAAYPMHPQQITPVQPSNTVSAGRPYMSNTGQSDYTSMYYRPPRQPSGNAMRAPLNTGLYTNDGHFSTTAAAISAWPYSVRTQYNTATSAPGGGLVHLVDGWPASAIAHDAKPPDSSALQMNPGHYIQASPDDGLRAQKTSHVAYYAPPHVRESMMANYGGVVSGDQVVSQSYPVPQMNELTENTHFLAPISTIHQVNGSMTNGQPTSADSYVPLRRNNKHESLSAHQGIHPHPEQQRLMDEFNRLTVEEYQNADVTHALQPSASAQTDMAYRQRAVTSQWGYAPDNTILTTETMDSRTGGLIRSNVASHSAVSTNHLHVTSGCAKPQSSPAPLSDGPRMKTWANIAGQPPRGSAAVLIGSTTGWSAKRMPGQVLNPNNHRTAVPHGTVTIASATGGKSTHASTASNGIEKSTSHPHPSYRSADSGGVIEDPSGVAVSSGKNDTLGYNESMQALRRESEALYQRLAKSINPTTFDTNIEKARFFVIKSFSEDDIHRSIKYAVWCSTELGNKKLDAAFVAANNQFPIYLFFSVNGSGHFCGMAEMTSRVDYDTRVRVWAQDKWQGAFSVRWIFVKDVPNTALRHIRVETNENKPVTHSRDTTELPLERGRQVAEVFANYSHTLSIFDDFLFYEQRERQDVSYYFWGFTF